MESGGNIGRRLTKKRAESGIRQFCAALGTEFRAGFQRDSALGAMLFFVDFCAAFRAEFRVGLEWSAALRAGGAYALPPAFLLKHGAVTFRHFRVRPYLLHGKARLGGGHFNARIGRALLAQTFRLIPAAFPADPRRASRALHEIRTKLLHGFFKSFVMSFFPCCRTGFFAQIGYLS